MPFKFLEYDGEIPLAVDRKSLIVFRLDDAPEDKWVNIDDRVSLAKILANSVEISRSEAEALAAARAEDRRKS